MVDIKLEIEKLIKLVEESYANNSELYKYFEAEASLDEIIMFLQIDGLQPCFYDYINYAKEISPKNYFGAMDEQLKEEEGHSDYYKDMLKNIDPDGKIDPFCDQTLSTVHQTFIKDFIHSKGFAHFVGGFYATELMSSKRYQQILNRLEELKVPKDKIEYIYIHAENDTFHSSSALSELVRPLIEESSTNIGKIFEGAKDRLYRSEQFLFEYERKLGIRDEQSKKSS